MSGFPFKKTSSHIQRSVRRYYSVSLKSIRSQAYFIDENDWCIRNMAAKMPY